MDVGLARIMVMALAVGMRMRAGCETFKNDIPVRHMRHLTDTDVMVMRRHPRLHQPHA